MRSVRFICFAFLAGAASISFSVAAQQVESPSEYVEVRLIQIEVRVTRDGNPVSDLREEDFVVREDGKIQEISHFEYLKSPAAYISGAVSPEAEEPAAPVAPPTWLYIVPEFAGPQEFVRTAPALREFILKEIPAGFRVSIGGLPFTDEKKLLLGILDRMLEGPYGGEGGPSVVDPTLAQVEDLEFQRLLAEEVRKSDDQLVPLSGFGRDPLFSGTGDQVRFFKIERIDRQIPLYGRLALLRYRDLVRRMAPLPGKKAVVLFRPGLRLDKDNFNLMNQLVSEAVRQRVSFYTLDPGGLDTVIATEDRRATLAWESGRYRPNTNIMREHMDRSEARAGLQALAEESGGRGIDNTNDMGAVLQAVAEDASDYYLIEYYASEKKSRGDFHGIEVEVGRPGVRVETIPGYYEPKALDQQSDRDRSRALYEAMVSSVPEQLAVEGSAEVFADSNLQPVLVYSAGVRPEAVTWEKQREGMRTSLAYISRVNSPLVVQLPDYQEQQLEPVLSEGQYEELCRKPARLLTLSSQLEVLPGLHSVKMVLQDRDTGKLGSFEKLVEVPDFTQSSTPSTLLLTTRVQLVPRGEEAVQALPDDAENPENILEVGDLIYFPQSANVFTRGDVIYLLYHLYNPTLNDLDHALRGIQLGLLRNGIPVTDVRANGEATRETGENRIRFKAFIRTDNLEPGNYSVMAFLPDWQNRELPGLEERFRLLPGEEQDPVQ